MAESNLITLNNYIEGKFQNSKCNHWIDNYSPATGDLIARIPCSSTEDIDDAVTAATNAFNGWSS